MTGVVTWPVCIFEPQCQNHYNYRLCRGPNRAAAVSAVKRNRQIAEKNKLWTFCVHIQKPTDIEKCWHPDNYL